MFLILLCFLIFCLFLIPNQTVAIVSAELTLWYKHMLPALFPFMLLSGIIIKRQYYMFLLKWINPIFHKLFRTSIAGSFVLFSGFTCGFPMGAKVISELLSEKQISSEEGTRLLLFCNNIGPIYMIQLVCPKLQHIHPFIALLIMYMIPLIDGFFLCHKRPEKCLKLNKIYSKNNTDIFTSIDFSIHQSIHNITLLGGYMICFGLLQILLLPLPQKLQMYLSCLIEISYGIHYATSVSQSYLGEIIILSLLPLGGLCCLGQTKSLFTDQPFPLIPYIKHKLLQAFSTFFFYLIYSLF